MPELKEIRVGKYLLAYPSDMEVKTYSEPWYHGIVFYLGDTSIEVIHNYDMKTERLFVSHKNLFPNLNMYLLSQDIPFKEATFSFLPEGVTATILEESNEDRNYQKSLVDGTIPGSGK